MAESKSISTAAKTLFTQNEGAVKAKAVKLYRKIASNIINNPEEPKYRSISIEKVIPKFKGAKGSMELLLASGFEKEDKSLVLKQTTGLQGLRRALEQFSAFEAPAAPKTEAQLRLEEIQAKNKAMMKKKKEEKEARRKKMRAKIEEAKDDKKDRVVNSSRACKLKFGATLKAFEPPKEKRG